MLYRRAKSRWVRARVMEDWHYWKSYHRVRAALNVQLGPFNVALGKGRAQSVCLFTVLLLNYFPAGGVKKHGMCSVLQFTVDLAIIDG